MRAVVRTFTGLAAVAIAIAVAPARADSPMSKDKLAGSWKLIGFKATTGDKVSHPLGERPGGFVGFNSGRFWVMLVDTGRKAPASAVLTDAEAVALMKSAASYTGRYDADPAQTEDGIKLTIHVDAATNQALTGTNRVFFMRVEGDKLTVKSPATVVATTGETSIVQLDFVRSD